MSFSLSRYDKNERDFLGEVFSRRIFGAIYAALMVRKHENGLTRAMFGARTGRDKTGVSKMLNGPGNWTTNKISDMANALDLDIDVCFIDRHNRSRIFTATGVTYRAPLSQAHSKKMLYNFSGPQDTSCYFQNFNPDNRAITSVCAVIDTQTKPNSEIGAAA